MWMMKNYPDAAGGLEDVRRIANETRTLGIYLEVIDILLTFVRYNQCKSVFDDLSARNRVYITTQIYYMQQLRH